RSISGDRYQQSNPAVQDLEWLLRLHRDRLHLTASLQIRIYRSSLRASFPKCFAALRAIRVGTTDFPRGSPSGDLLHNFTTTNGSLVSRRLSLVANRVDGSGGALFDRCATAYRRVAQSRICTTVYTPAQSSRWGVRPLSRVARIERATTLIEL